MTHPIGMIGVWMLLFTSVVSGAELIKDEFQAAEWFRDFEAVQAVVYPKYYQAKWIYDTNLTDHNLQKQLEASVEKSKAQEEGARNASLYDWKNFQDEDLQRKFSKIATIGLASLGSEKATKGNTIKAEMERMYSTSVVCNKPGDTSGKCYPLAPDLRHIISMSRDWDELLWAWQGWRDASGKKFKSHFTEYVELNNEAARHEGFEDTGDYWRALYETDTFEQDVADIWEQVKPMYQQLHYYVKNKLKAMYPGNSFPSSGHIPAHILGNMWTHWWSTLYDELVPFKGERKLDITQALVDQGYDAKMMFKLSEEFFTSLGLAEMPQSFWDHSLIEKPDDRDLVCHPSDWDFFNGQDFRIIQCTVVTHEHLVNTHHEMGHMQYYLQYKDNPIVYREGANPGFHEAIGDALALSVTTPEHLKKIGLIDNIGNDTRSDLNFLLYMALDKISFMPFAYVMDLWRWDVFRGNIKPDDYTHAWANLRCKHQGVSPPVMRTKEDFDPGSKYHIPGGVPYIRYFISYTLQFQFHKALCEAAWHQGPLHRCGIYRSQEAGTLLANMMKLGSTKPWPDAMEQLTGQRSISADALVEYFAPLTEWLKEQNGDADVSWEEECPPGSFQENAAATLATINFVIVVFIMLFVVL